MNLVIVLICFVLICFGKEEDSIVVDCESSSGDVAADDKDVRAVLSDWLSDSFGDDTPLDTFSPEHFAIDTSDDCEFEIVGEPNTEHVSVLDAVKELTSEATNDRVFLMLNGANTGVWFNAKYKSGCLGSLADAAADLLGASSLDRQLPKRLYTANGIPIQSDKDLLEKTHGLIHVLMEQETWVWPGIEVGFRWQVGAHSLHTVSLAPRLIYVHNMLTPKECDQLMEEAQPRFTASPVKDYSDAPEFKNFRTSETAHMSRSKIADIVHTRAWLTTRLPLRSCVETTQVVRYGDPKAWFKPHMDIYHNWEGWPDEKNEDNGAKALFEEWIGAISLRVAKGLLDEGSLPLAQKPSLESQFQLFLVELILKAGAPLLDDSWREWLQTNFDNRPAGLFDALIESKPAMFDEGRLLWERECIASLVAAKGDKQVDADKAKQLCEFDRDANNNNGEKKPRKRIVPNRHVTVFHYLNDVERGGETVFPQATRTQWNGTDSWQPEERPDMPQCTQGIAVRPRKGNSVIFYHRHGNMEYDSLSQHGGCPPLGGEVKYGANSFSWNVDSIWGYRQWNM